MQKVVIAPLRHGKTWAMRRAFAEALARGERVVWAGPNSEQKSGGQPTDESGGPISFSPDDPET